MSLPRFVISAPFGNYIQPDGAVATLGTFTAKARGGRLWRILKTVRFYPRLRAWVNKIGLRNPGVDWLVSRVESGRIGLERRLVSIHGFEADEWYVLLDKVAALEPTGIELNMSCPNVGHVDWPVDLFERAKATGVPIVTKLPPVRFETMFEQATAAGIRTFHCCNTLPVPAGGISGAPLKPVALQCIARVQELAGDTRDELRIVGGGGIREVADVDDYAAAGVHAIAVGTKVMNPKFMLSCAALKPLQERAEELLAQREVWLS